MTIKEWKEIQQLLLFCRTEFLKGKVPTQFNNNWVNDGLNFSKDQSSIILNKKDLYGSIMNRGN
jgi:hypothetical protein